MVCTAQNSTKYFFKSEKQIKIASTLKSSLIEEASISQWFWKLDGALSLTRFTYVGGTQGIQVDAFKMVGVGISYQQITVVNGQNYAPLVLKALIDLPTINDEKLGICVGPYLWNNTVGVVIGYTLGDKYPFIGINGSWNF
jgi:hypothetical protein